MKLKLIYGLVLLIIIVSIPLFAHLSEVSIQMWDEGRVAMKALEMTTSRNWLITTVNGQPDMSNVKPPLLTWIQAIFIHLMGPNELAIRLPSALAALATCILIYWFFTWKYIKEVWLGIICNLLLVSCMGYVTLHGTRTGDYDTLLTLFTTGYILFFFLYLEEGKTAYLNITVALLTLAVYTKGIQGVLFLPALFIYVVLAKKSALLFKEKWFYIGAVMFVVLTIGYYLARDHYNPGYIFQVWYNELGGRYGNVMEGHRESFFYFFSWIVERAFTYWYPALVAGIAAALLTKDKQLRRLVIYLSVVSLTYILVISDAQTKCWWYIMPVMPFMAIIAGTFINSIFKVLAGLNPQQFRFNILPYAFLTVIAYPAYIYIATMTMSRQPKELWDYVNGDITTALANVTNHNDKSMDGYLLLGTYEDNVTWYRDIIKMQHKPIQFLEGHNPGNASKVIAFRPESKHFIDSAYNARVVYTFGNVSYYNIDSKK